MKHSHVGKVNFNFLPHRKIIGVLVVIIEVLNIRDFCQVEDEVAGLVTVNRSMVLSISI